MNLQIGDSVKFLSEVGGGKVTKINSPISVTIETEDGFEIPTLVKDLIKIEAVTASQKMFVEENRNNIVRENAFPPAARNESIQTHVEPLIVGTFSKMTTYQAFFLAFVPREQTWLITGGIGIYIVNHTRHKVLFQLLTASKKSHHGEIPPFTRFHLMEISREEIEEFREGIVQIMLLPNSDGEIFMPSSIDYKVKGSRFYQESSYIKPEYFYEKALIYRLLDVSTLPQLTEKSAIELKKEDEVVIVKATPQKKNDEILLYKTADGEAEVDMHIWKLVDDHTFMTNDEMLNLQLNYFERCLSSAIEHNFRKVIFIHGVGTGRLKDEIRAKLDEYHFVQYKSASMAQYGVGATEVEISVNR